MFWSWMYCFGSLVLTVLPTLICIKHNGDDKPEDYHHISSLSNQDTRHAHCSLLEYIVLKISGESYKYEVLLSACPKFSTVLTCCKVK